MVRLHPVVFIVLVKVGRVQRVALHDEAAMTTRGRFNQPVLTSLGVQGASTSLRTSLSQSIGRKKRCDFTSAAPAFKQPNRFVMSFTSSFWMRSRNCTEEAAQRNTH
jgi:hypothetical protein